MLLQKDGIKLRGYVGEWHVIADAMLRGKMCYLLEHKTYSNLIVDEDLNILIDDVWNGFSDLVDTFPEFDPNEIIDIYYICGRKIRASLYCIHSLLLPIRDSIKWNFEHNDPKDDIYKAYAETLLEFVTNAERVLTSYNFYYNNYGLDD